MMFLIIFLKFLFSINNPNIEFGEQCPRGRCTVSERALSMSSFPDGAMITLKSSGRDAGEQPLPQCLYD